MGRHQTRELGFLREGISVATSRQANPDWVYLVVSAVAVVVAVYLLSGGIKQEKHPPLVVEKTAEFHLCFAKTTRAALHAIRDNTSLPLNPLPRKHYLYFVNIHFDQDVMYIPFIRITACNTH
jgi:hypothetical protein